MSVLPSQVGIKFNRLTILEDFIKIDGCRWARTLCECGREQLQNLNLVKRGNSKTCGKCLPEEKAMKKLLGRKFGMVEVIKSIEVRNEARIVLAKCDCGVEFTTHAGSLIQGNTRSCGCYNVSSRRKDIDDDCFSEINERSAYWAGFLAADGCLSRSRSVSLALAPVDTGHVEKYASFLKSDHKIRITKKSAFITFNSEKITEDLKKFGLTPRKSRTYDPPESIRGNIDFWRGMIDGDGCIWFNKRGYPHIELCGSEACMEAFRAFAANINGSETKVRKSKSIFKVVFANKKAVALISALYYDGCEYYLDRKMISAQKAMEAYGIIN